MNPPTLKTVTRAGVGGVGSKVHAGPYQLDENLVPFIVVGGERINPFGSKRFMTIEINAEGEPFKLPSDLIVQDLSLTGAMEFNPFPDNGHIVVEKSISIPNKITMFHDFVTARIPSALPETVIAGLPGKLLSEVVEFPFLQLVYPQDIEISSGKFIPKPTNGSWGATPDGSGILGLDLKGCSPIIWSD